MAAIVVTLAGEDRSDNARSHLGSRELLAHRFAHPLATMVKGCVWESSTTARGARPECSLLSRIPKVVRSGNLAVDTEKEARRKAFAFVVKAMWQQPEMCLSVQSYVQGQLELLSVPSGDKESFAIVTTLGKLEKDERAWVASFISELTTVPLSSLEKAISFDDDCLRHILQYLLCLPMSWKLPEECTTKFICKGLLMHWCQKVGNRYRLIAELMNTKPFVMEDGRLNWADFGVYRMEWSNEGIGVSVVHVPKGVIAHCPTAVKITKEWKARYNFSDEHAVIMFDRSTQKFIDLFTERGPRDIKPLTGRQAVVEIKSKIEALQAEHAHKQMALLGSSSSGAASSQTFVSPNKPKSEETAEKARQGLKKRRESEQEKRTFTLGSPKKQQKKKD